ncbi:hypothetical protein, partial [Hungatella effluvii]|uniref:hypothetical protein n=1 Tax=Hungatella effluvii TaxID=1096246 RepID=UPI0022E8C9E5
NSGPINSGPINSGPINSDPINSNPVNGRFPGISLFQREKGGRSARRGTFRHINSDRKRRCRLA